MLLYYCGRGWCCYIIVARTIWPGLVVLYTIWPGLVLLYYCGTRLLLLVKLPYWAGAGATRFYLAGAGATILLWLAAAAIRQVAI